MARSGPWEGNRLFRLGLLRTRYRCDSGGECERTTRRCDCIAFPCDVCRLFGRNPIEPSSCQWAAGAVRDVTTGCRDSTKPHKDRLRPRTAEAECSCRWRGHPAEFPEHLTGIAKAARDRISEFVEFVGEEIADGSWRWIDRFEPDRGFLTPADFARAMNNLGFRRPPRRLQCQRV